MKAILLTRTGDPSVLEYAEVPTPRPQPGEVLVKADTIGVSRPELLVRRGVYAWMPPLPVIPGIEMAGTVAEVGAGVTRFAAGDKVYVTAREQVRTTVVSPDQPRASLFPRIMDRKWHPWPGFARAGARCEDGCSKLRVPRSLS